MRGGGWVLLFAGFLGAALVLYEPALDGPFVSDDNHYVARNSYVHGLTLENVGAILHPAGGATIAVVNYTPVHLLLHAGAWQAFGDDVRGHHVVNVCLHALASVLLAALLLASGVPRNGALLGGAIFLVHPANVEAVAWISQLKTSSSMCLTLAALLAFRRHPGWGTLLFGLALLAKPTAAVALPVAVAMGWARREPAPWRWYALCAVLFAAYSVVEFTVHQRSGAAEAVLHDTPFVLLRTMAALALRYVVMSATSWGVSAFHEPEPAWSLADPWWLASLVVLGLLGWRLLVVLRRREVEAAYWIWALVSYGPVSQLFPFLYPLADRYLYFILPGLLGGALLAGREALARLPAERRPQAAAVALAAGVALVAAFAVRSHDRAGIWSSPARLVADAALHYPQGVSANLLRAKRAAQIGDAAGAVRAIRAAVARGYNRYEQLLADPAFSSVRGDPAFRRLVAEIAGGWIESLQEKPDPTQLELRQLAHAHVARGEYDDAARVLRAALARGGRHDAPIREDLEQLERGTSPGLAP